MERVRLVTVLSIGGVVAAGAVAMAVNTQILGAVSAGSETSTESIRVAEDAVDPSSVTPEQTKAAAAATAQQAQLALTVASLAGQGVVSQDSGAQALNASESKAPGKQSGDPTAPADGGAPSAASTPNDEISPEGQPSPEGSQSPNNAPSPSGTDSTSPSESPTTSPSDSTSPSNSEKASASPTLSSTDSGSSSATATE